MDKREKILTNDLGSMMLDTVSPIYDNSELTLNIFEAFGETLSKERDFIRSDFIKQMFPQTATWGLRLWEDEYGITTDVSKTIEQRRQYLMSVMFKKRPMTPKRLEQIVTGLTGFECKITENIEPNTVLVTIRGYVQNIKPVKDNLDTKVPAHLNYKIKMAAFTGIGVSTVSVAAATTYKRYELEVLN